MPFRFNVRRSLGLPIGGGGAVLKPQDVFATSLYSGNGIAGRAINNGLDMAGKGGFSLFKTRNVAGSWALFDTLRPLASYLSTNTTNAEATDTRAIQSFTSSGFVLGDDQINALTNFSGRDYAVQSFARAPKFFDIVTWTGDGTSNRQIPHGLGVVPGMIIGRQTDGAMDWFTKHQSVSGTLKLNTTDAVSGLNIFTNVTATSFQAFNTSGARYVAYLFAHDPSADGIVQCGSYVGGADVSINLGWRPQLLMVKIYTSATDWIIVDATRGFGANGNVYALNPNKSSAEFSFAQGFDGFTATGFRDSGFYNAGSNNTAIYLAIRAPY